MHISGPLKTWREEVGRRYLNLDFHPATDEPLHVSLKLNFAHGGVRLGRLKHSAGATFRDRELIQQDGDACFTLLMPHAGPLNVGHQGRSLDVGANDATVVHNCQPGHVGASRACDFSALILPEDQFKRLDINGSAMVGGVWRRNNGAFQLLKGYLACLAKAPPTTSAAVRAAAADHIVELAALAARDVVQHKGDAGEEHESVRAARLQLALQYIAQNIGDPALSIARLAASQGVSVRYIYVLFESAGLQFTAYVNECRLQHIYAALGRRDDARRTIADIALRAGFSDISHFNRVFRRRFGFTPSALRSGHQDD